MILSVQHIRPATPAPFISGTEWIDFPLRFNFTPNDQRELTVFLADETVQEVLRRGMSDVRWENLAAFHIVCDAVAEHYPTMMELDARMSTREKRRRVKEKMKEMMEYNVIPNPISSLDYSSDSTSSSDEEHKSTSGEEQESPTKKARVVCFNHVYGPDGLAEYDALSLYDIAISIGYATNDHAESVVGNKGGQRQKKGKRRAKGQRRAKKGKRQTACLTLWKPTHQQQSLRTRTPRLWSKRTSPQSSSASLASCTSHAFGPYRHTFKIMHRKAT
eukprot:SAG31_NODE_98_length_25640_cov_9.936744_2_plen_275_part_00